MKSILIFNFVFYCAFWLKLYNYYRKYLKTIYFLVISEIGSAPGAVVVLHKASRVFNGDVRLQVEQRNKRKGRID